jgi:hypothetical protein
MARISMTDFYNPIKELGDTIADYITRKSGEIAEVFHKQTLKGHLTITRDIDGTETKFLTMPLDGQNEEPLEPISGLYSLDELLDLPINKPKPFIEDLINEGETTLIAGRPKVGKSRIVNQMAISLANGIPFLGMKVPLPRCVLVVDLENKPGAIKDRYKRMGGQQMLKNGNVFIWCANTLSENGIDSSEPGIRKLEMLIAQTQAEVLIIDPWRLWLGEDENDALKVVRGLKLLTSLRKNHPALAIVIVHHVRKERFESPAKLIKDPSLWIENISGHYSLVGHVDACYGLERQIDDNGETVVFGGVARNNEPRTILLDDDPDSLRFDVANNEEAAKTAMTQKEFDLWEKAKKKISFTWTGLIAEAGTKTKKLVSSMLKKAEAHGLIEKTERGGYRIIIHAGG